MTDFVVESLILDLLEWIAKQDRSYDDTMDAWRTSCPKLPVWEDATDRGLIELDADIVRLTSAGRPPRGKSALQIVAPQTRGPRRPCPISGIVISVSEYPG